MDSNVYWLIDVSTAVNLCLKGHCPCHWLGRRENFSVLNARVQCMRISQLTNGVLFIELDKHRSIQGVGSA